MSCFTYKAVKKCKESFIMVHWINHWWSQGCHSPHNPEKGSYTIHSYIFVNLVIISAKITQYCWDLFYDLKAAHIGCQFPKFYWLSLCYIYNFCQGNLVLLRFIKRPDGCTNCQGILWALHSHFFNKEYHLYQFIIFLYYLANYDMHILLQT